MSASALKKEHYTYADICAMKDDIRRELIDGVIYNMTTPNNNHQAVSGEIVLQLGNFQIGRAHV